MDEFEFGWRASKEWTSYKDEYFDPILLAKAVHKASCGNVVRFTQSAVGRSQIVVAINSGRLICHVIGDSVADDMQDYIARLVKVLDVRCPCIRYTYDTGVYRKIRSTWL